MDYLGRGQWKLTLIHTNDSHGHIESFPVVTTDISSQLRLCKNKNLRSRLGGFGHLATVVNDIRKNNPYTLLLESGDTFSDTMLANLTKGRLQLSLMNKLKYDAMCPGNHDIDYGAKELKKISEEADFPILAANLLYKESDDCFLGKPYVFKTVNDLKIGIYGLTYHLTPETTSKKNIKQVKYTLNLKQIQKDIQIMKSHGAKIIIVLSHLGTSVDEKVAKEVTGIDLILGGHSHDPIALRKVNGVILAQSPSHLTGLGCLELTISKREITLVEGKIIPIESDKIIPDKTIENIINKVKSIYKNSLYHPLGYAASPIIRNYKTESPVETLLGNSIRLFTGSEISILPGVGYGVTIPSGIVVAEQIQNFFPHKSAIYTCYLKGEDIIKAINQSIYNQINPDVTERVGGLIQTTGLQFSYTYDSQLGNYVKSINVSGQPLKVKKYYKVAMNQLMIEGGHKYESLKNAVNIQKSPFTDISLIKEIFNIYPSIYTSSQGWSIPVSKEDYEKGQKKCFR